MTSIDFSIVIPFKFGGKYACNCFSSIITAFQEIHFSVIVVLDNPSDSEMKLLQVAIDKFTDLLPLEIAISPGSGISDALNHGIEISRADYIVRHDIDDLCFKWRGKRLLEMTKSYPDFIFGSVVCFPLPIYLKVPSSKEEAISVATNQNPFYHPASCFRRAAIIEIGGYKTAYNRLEDYELWVRVLESCLKLKFDFKPHTKYRKHALQFTRQVKGLVVDDKRELLRHRARTLSSENKTVKSQKYVSLGLYYFLLELF